MMKRIAVAVASCLALAGCGGDSGGNAAAGKTFNYGASAQTNSTQSSALDVQLSSALALKSAPDATSAQDLASVSDITSALLGNSAVVTGTSPAQQRLLAIGARAAASQLVSAGGAAGGSAFENPACVVTTPTSIKMTGCTITVTDPSMTSKVQVDGSLSFDPVKGTLTWELTVSDATSFTAQGVSGAASVHVHESGTLTVTDTTIKGQLLAEASASGSSAAGSASLGVSEAVTVDITYADGAVCSSRVTSGTVEAKRVWTDRGGVSAAQLPDKAAKVTWTACGVGTIAFSQ
jgi:hypothetical protein